MDRGKLQWHPAFSAALRISLQDEMQYLEMREEYLLSKKPPQIDVLIIRKLRDVPLKKSISRIFRGHNIIEYKAPDDYLSINDFYKVYGYACFYQSNTERVKEIDPEELTITFACSHYPGKMLKHLSEVRGIHTECREKGIYYLTGDPIPMQLLITRELAQKENYWLQNLRSDLKAGPEIRNLMAAYEKNRHSKDHEAVMNLITHANMEQMEVEKKMCDALRELFADELKEADEKGRAAGMELAKRVFNLSFQGKSEEDIAEQCEITVEQVKKILEQIEGEKKTCDALRELFADELKEADEKGRAAGMELAKRVFNLSFQGKSEEDIAEQCEITVEQVKKILE